MALTMASLEHGAGADNAPGHTSLPRPGEAPVASDSGSTNVGVKAGQNNPGEKGIDGKPVDPKPDSFGACLLASSRRVYVRDGAYADKKIVRRDDEIDEASEKSVIRLEIDRTKSM